MQSIGNESAQQQDGADPKASRHSPGRLGKDLLDAYKNMEAFNDVTLVGNDGGKVLAPKLLLAARSTYFERLLMGRFEEGSKDEICLQHPSCTSEVLEYLVEYLISNEIRRFRSCIYLPHDEDFGKFEAFGDVLRIMVRVDYAAHYLGLDSLQSYVEAMIHDRMFATEYKEPADGYTYHPNIETDRLDEKDAAAIYDESTKYQELTNIQSLALRRIVDLGIDELIDRDVRDSPDGLTMDQYHDIRYSPVYELRYESLLQLIEELSPSCGKGLFEAIYFWGIIAPAHANDLMHASSMDGPVIREEKEHFESKEMFVESRLTSAKQLVSKVDLRFLPTQYLLGRVNDSGLVTPEHILKVQNMQFKSAYAFVRGADTDIVNGLYEWGGHVLFEEGTYESCSYKKSVDIDGVRRNLFLYSDREGTYIALAPQESDYVTDGDGMDTLYKTNISVDLLNAKAALSGEQNLLFNKGTTGEGESPFPTVDFSPLQNKASTLNLPDWYL